MEVALVIPVFHINEQVGSDVAVELSADGVGFQVVGDDDVRFPQADVLAFVRIIPVLQPEDRFPVEVPGNL